MDYEITWLTGLLVVASGFIAGFINTIAGGGSMLTLPALMILGLPADIANATNRVGVILQAVAGTRGFYQRGRLDLRDILPMLLPVLLGSLLGSLLASYLPREVLKPVLLGVMLAMALLMLLRPASMAPPPGSEVLKLSAAPAVWGGLFCAGLYGGFVQAGVGFIIIAALAGGLRYDLVRTNALKVAITAILTALALAIFVLRDQVLWGPGLLLSVGTVAGAMLSVRFAVAVPQSVLQWVLFTMVLLTCAAAWFSG